MIIPFIVIDLSRRLRRVIIFPLDFIERYNHNNIKIIV